MSHAQIKPFNEVGRNLAGINVIFLPVDIYLPSELQNSSGEDAKKVGLSLSRFVFEAVEAFLAARNEKLRSLRGPDIMTKSYKDP